MFQIFGMLLLVSILIIALFGIIDSHWWIGGLFALLMFDTAFERYKDSKLTDEQWRAKYPDKTERGNSKGSVVLYSVLGLIFCVIAYWPFYR